MAGVLKRYVMERYPEGFEEEGRPDEEKEVSSVDGFPVVVVVAFCVYALSGFYCPSNTQPPLRNMIYIYTVVSSLKVCAG